MSFDLDLSSFIRFWARQAKAKSENRSSQARTSTIYDEAISIATCQRSNSVIITFELELDEMTFDLQNKIPKSS